MVTCWSFVGYGSHGDGVVAVVLVVLALIRWSLQRLRLAILGDFVAVSFRQH